MKHVKYAWLLSRIFCKENYSNIFLFLKLWIYDKTSTGDLENTEQRYIYLNDLLQLFK